MITRKNYAQALMGVCVLILAGCASIAHKENAEMNSHTTFNHTTGRLVVSTDTEIYVEEIGIDSRGHGRSSLGRTKLSYKKLTDDLMAVINVLDLQKFSIFGFSDGGVVAYRYAAGKDNRLQKVVTVGASCDLGRK